MQLRHFKFKGYVTTNNLKFQVDLNYADIQRRISRGVTLRQT